MEKLYTFDEYRKMVENDLKFDRMSLEEYQMKLPALKHFYVAHLISNKIELEKLQELYSDAVEAKMAEILKNSDAPLGKVNAKNMAEATELPKKIKKSIRDKQLIIEYLEKLEKIFSSTSYDLKNVVDIIKLETT